MRKFPAALIQPQADPGPRTIGRFPARMPDDHVQVAVAIQIGDTRDCAMPAGHRRMQHSPESGAHQQSSQHCTCQPPHPFEGSRSSQRNAIVYHVLSLSIKRRPTAVSGTLRHSSRNPSPTHRRRSRGCSMSGMVIPDQPAPRRTAKTVSRTSMQAANPAYSQAPQSRPGSHSAGVRSSHPTLAAPARPHTTG